MIFVVVVVVVVAASTSSVSANDLFWLQSSRWEGSDCLLLHTLMCVRMHCIDWKAIC